VDLAAGGARGGPPERDTGSVVGALGRRRPDRSQVGGAARTGLDWSAPVVELTFIAVVTVLASLLASLWPAHSAARTLPAVALRLAD